VERMLDLRKKLAAATIPADKKLYRRQIEASDAWIDALVYELSWLTEEHTSVARILAHSLGTPSPGTNRLVSGKLRDDNLLDWANAHLRRERAGPLY
jgi:hypothetical protein